MLEIGYITLILKGMAQDFGTDRRSNEHWHAWFFRKIVNSPELKDTPHSNFQKNERKEKNGL